MRASRPSDLRLRRLGAALLLVAAGLFASACREVESGSAAGYEPAKLEPIRGADDEAKRVTFTSEGAARTDLRTGTVRRSGERTVVPYAALLYNDEAKTFVYTRAEPLSYERQPVTVDRIEGDRVYLSAGPSAGTEVVTVGATEVYGAELEIAKK